MACESESNGPQNPLLIDLVIERVLSFLDTHSLLSARQVCKRWYWLSSPYLKCSKLPQVDLWTSDRIYAFLSVATTIHPPAPWQSFSLDLFGKEISRNDVQLFFDICGDSVRELNIISAPSPDLVDLFRVLVRNVPRVRELKFDGLQALVTNQLNRSVSRYLRYDYGINRVTEFLTWYESNETSPVFPHLETLQIVLQIEVDNPNLSFQFFRALFTITPQLKSLKVSCLDVTTETATIPGLMRALLQSPVLNQLSALRIDDLDDRSIRILAEQKSLRLKELSLLALSRDVRGPSLVLLLQRQAPYLEELSLGGQYCCGGSVLKLRLNCVMPRLKTLNFVGGLHIGTHFEYIMALLWEGINYQEQFPQLETLGLWYLTKHAMNSIFPGHATMATCNILKTIKFVGGVETIDPSKIRLLGVLFPGLENLTVTISSHLCFPALFETWPKLKFLEVNIIAIIPRLDFHFTGKCLDCSPACVAALNQFPPVENTKECLITNLQELRKLRVKMDFKPGMPGPPLFSLDYFEFLTDTTGMALLQLPKLKHLSINKSKMSPDCIRMLRQELSLERCDVRDARGNLIVPTESPAESEDEYFSADEM